MGTVISKGYLPLISNLDFQLDSEIDDFPLISFRTLHAYTQTYLKEEILDEALVRNIAAFSRFLDLAADQSGKIVSFSTLSRDAGSSCKTANGLWCTIRTLCDT